MTLSIARSRGVAVGGRGGDAGRRGRRSGNAVSRLKAVTLCRETCEEREASGDRPCFFVGHETRVEGSVHIRVLC